MRSPQSVAALETLGRVRLSRTFFMRDFLYSEIGNFYGVPNIPDKPDLAVQNGKRLCEELLEPLQAAFGRIAIRSAYRSPAINALGNQKGHRCGSNESNFAAHIWDHPDKHGKHGATACVVVPWFLLSAMKTAPTGAPWPIGFTTTCRTASFSSFPGCAPSISGGTRSRKGSFTALWSPKARSSVVKGQTRSLLHTTQAFRLWRDTQPANEGNWAAVAVCFQCQAIPT